MAADKPIPSVTVTRSGVNTYTARSAGGAELRIGEPGQEGVFSPVELLQVAIAGCASMSAEPQLTSQLGEDFDLTTTVDAVQNSEENRLEKLITTINTDLTELDPRKQEKLIARAEKFIEKLCTVKRTLKHGVETETSVQSGSV
ncbi:OsmC family protein [Corynebacterium halotolerans]|uniref:OsmC family protein n=1 Tax=Corynebacterium halotolerans TaxID=225326 RepID=UPI003CF027D1